MIKQTLQRPISRYVAHVLSRQRVHESHLQFLHTPAEQHHLVIAWVEMESPILKREVSQVWFMFLVPF